MEPWVLRTKEATNHLTVSLEAVEAEVTIRGFWGTDLVMMPSGHLTNGDAHEYAFLTPVASGETAVAVRATLEACHRRIIEVPCMGPQLRRLRHGESPIRPRGTNPAIQ